MRTISLMYHDVVEPAVHHLSGFPSADAALYKLAPRQFEAHLSALRNAVNDPPGLVTDLLADQGPSSRPLSSRPHSSSSWMLTFDDGGSSFFRPIADQLEARGWRGHFFITTNFINQPGFLTGEQICELDRRGHIIGSHSCSHPLRFASCPRMDLVREWSESVATLNSILGKQVQTASIPGGQYSRQVAETAASAGIKALFTSEPTTRTTQIDNCLVIGRYAIQRWMPPSIAARMAAGDFGPRFRQWALWEIKKLIKSIGKERYLKLRESLTS